MKKHLLSMAVLLMGAAMFTACDDNDNEQIGRASCRERV